MFYSEKFRNAIYWRYGYPCTYTIQYKLTGGAVICNKCGAVDFVRVPTGYCMQCVHCWKIFNELADELKFVKNKSKTELVFPEFTLPYHGVLQAVSDYRRVRQHGFICIHQYEYSVGFILAERRERAVRCAYLDTSKIEITPSSIWQYIKEAWDYERGEESGMCSLMMDYLNTPDTPIFPFTGQRRIISE